MGFFSFYYNNILIYLQIGVVNKLKYYIELVLILK